jgi:iron-sulfur cluster assembly accessory protein
MDTSAPAAGPRVADERLIRLTAPAGGKVLALAAREAQGRFLRVAISGGGCNGLSYKMRFVGEAKPADILVRSAGVEVLVDPKSALYLRGTHLDYSDKMIGGGFPTPRPAVPAARVSRFSAKAQPSRGGTLTRWHVGKGGCLSRGRVSTAC